MMKLIITLVLSQPKKVFHVCYWYLDTKQISEWYTVACVSSFLGEIVLELTILEQLKVNV